jgi:hypothetical protein
MPIRLDHVTCQENDFKVLQEILSVLNPTELAVKELSKESSNLLTCEGVFKFLFDVLAKQGSELTEMMLEALRKRYIERRNKDLVSLLKYVKMTSNTRRKQRLLIALKMSSEKNFTVKWSTMKHSNHSKCLNKTRA